MGTIDTKFQKWLMEHQPADNMLWKKAFWNTYVFWRDTVIPMFILDKNKSWDKICEEMDRYTEIVGQHTSKSIINPVLKITYKGTEIVFRYNFYDYEIAVVSNKLVSIPMDGLFRSAKASFFYQGFPNCYVLNERYESDKCRFMASLGTDYQFYTFMFLLKHEIDKSPDL